jgi:hypothetical protein
MEILKSLAIISIVVFLGISSRKLKIFSKEHVKVISSFVYHFAIPSLLFVSISRMDLSTLDFSLILAAALPIILIILFLYAVKLLGFLSKSAFVLLSLSVAFGSNAFFGIAFFETLYDGKWANEAILMASVLGLVGMFFTLLLFEYATQKGNALDYIVNIIKNPTFISIALGIIFSIFNFNFSILFNSLSLLGETAGGIAVFSLGIFIYDNFEYEKLKKAFRFSIFRFLILPIVTFIILSVLGDISNEMKSFLFIQSGIPAAISLAVFAERYEYKLAEVTGIVILTSIFSAIGILILFLISRSIYPF